MKKNKIDLSEVIEEILKENKDRFVVEAALQYSKTDVFRKYINELMDKGLGQNFIRAIDKKILDVSDYFTREFEKKFAAELTNLSEKSIAKNLESNKKFEKMFSKKMEVYLQEMS